MDLGLHGKVAAVAAASSGLGRAVAVALAEEGMSVAICSRDRERIQAAAALVDERARQKAGEGARPTLGMAVDLATEDGPGRFIHAAEEHFGRVDVLVANCGGPPPGAAVDLGEKEWAQGIPLTFLSSTRLASAALPGMLKRGWGRIIFITSISVKQPIENLAVSTTLRAAVVAYAKSLSDEVASEGITVNSVAPGSTNTERLLRLISARAEQKGMNPQEVKKGMLDAIPARRLGEPEEFAAAVAFLASERAAFISGVVLPVDGGQVRSIT